MNCLECGHPFLEPVRETVPYECGLPGVFIENTEVQHCSHCDNYEVSIYAMERLHEALVAAVLGKPRALKPVEIKFLRKARGWSSQDTAHRMRVRPATMSRWEAGTQKMSDSMEQLFRMLVKEARPVDEYADVAYPDDNEDPQPITARLEGNEWCTSAK